MKQKIIADFAQPKAQWAITSLEYFSINTLERAHLQAWKNSNKKLQ